MNKRCIVVLILLTCVFSVFASETRTFSMGQIGLFLRDNSNVLPFPGTLMYYNNEIITELRIKDAENQFSGGVHLPFMNTNAVAGVYLNRPLLPMDPLGVGNNVALLRTTDLMYGMKMGRNNVGFRLSYASDAFDQDAPNIEETARYMEAAAGISSQKYDLGVNVYMPSVENKTDFVDDEYSAFGFGVNGRYFYRASEKMEYVPVLIIGYTSGSEDYKPIGGTTETTDFSALAITIAAAMNYQVDENNLIVLGIQPYSQTSTTTDVQNVGETTTTFTIFPAIHLGGETRIASWLVGRIGAFQAFQTTETETKPDGGTTTKSSSAVSILNFSFGLGVEVGNFVIDFDLNDGTLFEGPYILGGRARDTFNRVSVTYHFGTKKEDNK
jgi:hypothetical protein